MNPKDEIKALEEILDRILQSFEDAIKNGEEISDELQGMLAEEIQASTQRIIQLREQLTEQQEEQSQSENQVSLQVPPSSSAQLMWILAGQKVDAFVNYLATYPDPELQELLRNPSQLDGIIDQLMNMMPPGESPSQDGVDKAGINSSNIYGFRYDPKSQRLLVRFQGGSIYGYNGVPSGIFKAFQNGAIPAKTTGQNNYGKWWTGKIPSLGAAFYELIRKGGFEYQRFK